MFANTVPAITSLRSFKFCYNDEIRRIPFAEQFNFAQIVEKIYSIFSLEPCKLTLKYKDNEGDLITISSEEEFQFFKALNASNDILTLYVSKPENNYTGLKWNPPQPLVANPFYNNIMNKKWDKVSEKVERKMLKVQRKLEKETSKKPVARYVKDVTIEDGSVFKPGTPFVKTWRFRNEGSVAWPSGIVLMYVGKSSDQMSGPDTVPVVIDNGTLLQPNDCVDISVNLISPSEPGRYTGYWRLFDPISGKKFGPRAWVQIVVSSSSPSNSSSDDDHKKNKRKLDSKKQHKADKKVKQEVDKKKDQSNVINDDEDDDEDDDSNDGDSVMKDIANKELKESMTNMLSMLDRMGFHDQKENEKLLKEHNGDIDKVVQALVSKISLNSQPITDSNTTTTTATATAGTSIIPATSPPDYVLIDK